MRLASRESQNMKWHPATIEEVKVIVHGDLAECDAEQAAVFEHWCNQDDLGLALNCWIKGRTRPPNVGPARPVE